MFYELITLITLLIRVGSVVMFPLELLCFVTFPQPWFENFAVRFKESNLALFPLCFLFY